MRLTRSVPALLFLIAGVVVLIPGVGPASAGGEDLDPPVITFTNPTSDTEVPRGGGLVIEYTCTDDVDPAPSCFGQQTSGPVDLGWSGSSGEAVTFNTLGTYVFTVNTQDASLNSDDSALTVTVVNPMCGGQVVTVIHSLENPTSGPDVILIDQTFAGNWVDGLGGNDIICGSDVTDVIIGGSGNDRILAGAGNDLLFGGSGNDRIEGGTNIDRIEGDEGADTLLGGSQADRIEGGLGNDNVNGGPQSDRCLGQEGTDRQTACEVRTGFP